ncbi:phage replisome organizer N-terminal domain-containing protein [Megasphaera stantonii]|uniref:phage replisome organizer N-terminal domain-containing protein n=1 Tax=Megasphaera stantonii TaxID=2144175 RepID=UPI00294223CC|nr:phage replisome organizer N-terminal domain-containing protein [Megasphaera stantonii]
MKQLRWMKTKVGLFGDPKIMAILGQRHGETYFVVWFLLKDIAGTVNCDGYTCLSEQVPLTGEYIARVLRRRRRDVVEKALDFLEQIDLISREKKAARRTSARIGISSPRSSSSMLTCPTPTTRRARGRA